MPRRALFVSVIQEPPVLTSRERMDRLVDFTREMKADTLYVQIYRENKAWFPSKVGDSGPYRGALAAVSGDPFEYLIEKAHKAGIEVHAWVNLLSLGANAEAPLLKKYGPDILTRSVAEKKSLEDYKIDSQFFLEPGDPRVREELVKMVEEILYAYPSLDGLQFDYIRYPDMHPAFGRTPVNEERYKKATGASVIDEKSESWHDWQRGQVTGLLRQLSNVALAIRPDLVISTTGLVPYSRARLEAFQDWKFWVQSGLIEYVTLMAYPPDVDTFEKNIQDAQKQLGTLDRVNIAVGAYKFLKDPQTFETQWRMAEAAGFRSCVVFHYGNLLENPALELPLKSRRQIK